MLSVKAGDYLWMVEFRFGVPYPETIRKMVVTHTDSDTNRFECIPTSGTANRLYEFDANGVEYREDTTVGYERYLLIFENKDTIYDICDAVRCTKALYMAAQNDFNNASLEGEKKVKGKQISSICGLLFLMFDIANAAKCIV